MDLSRKRAVNHQCVLPQLEMEKAFIR
jgi:hypothetical protein